MPFLDLPHDWVSRISNYGISTRAKIRGHHKGSHRSQRFGTSLDFSDFRDYHAGDDVRLIDWNVYARTDRFYIKRYLDEQEMRVELLLDSSKSMSNKWLFARQLAYSLGIMTLGRDDRLIFRSSEQSAPAFSRKGKTGRKRFEKAIADLSEPAGRRFTEDAGRRAQDRPTVLFILSDGLEPAASWKLFLQRLSGVCKDIRFLQISAEEERDPGLGGDVRFIDAETEETVSVTVSPAARGAYLRKREQHLRELEAVCRTFGVRYAHVQAEDGLRHALFHVLMEKKWIQ